MSNQLSEMLLRGQVKKESGVSIVLGDGEVGRLLVSFFKKFWWSDEVREPNGHEQNRC